MLRAFRCSPLPVIRFATYRCPGSLRSPLQRFAHTVPGLRAAAAIPGAGTSADLCLGITLNSGMQNQISLFLFAFLLVLFYRCSSNDEPNFHRPFYHVFFTDTAGEYYELYSDSGNLLFYNDASNRIWLDHPTIKSDSFYYVIDHSQTAEDVLLKIRKFVEPYMVIDTMAFLPGAHPIDSFEPCEFSYLTSERYSDYFYQKHGPPEEMDYTEEVIDLEMDDKQLKWEIYRNKYDTLIELSDSTILFTKSNCMDSGTLEVMIYNILTGRVYMNSFEKKDSTGCAWIKVMERCIYTHCYFPVGIKVNTCYSNLNPYDRESLIDAFTYFDYRNSGYKSLRRKSDFCTVKRIIPAIRDNYRK